MKRQSQRSYIESPPPEPMGIPLNDRILIRRFKPIEETASGIIIANVAQEKPSEGVVVAVGPGIRDSLGRRMKPDVEVGDRVMFGKFSGQEIKVGYEDLLVMREIDIVVRFPPAPTPIKAAHIESTRRRLNQASVRAVTNRQKARM